MSPAFPIVGCRHGPRVNADKRRLYEAAVVRENLRVCLPYGIDNLRNISLQSDM